VSKKPGNSTHILKILRCEIQLQMHDDEKLYFTKEGNERQQNSYYESLGHPTLENVKVLTKTKIPKKVLAANQSCAQGV
jgi:hypothetical protein